MSSWLPGLAESIRRIEDQSHRLPTSRSEILHQAATEISDAIKERSASPSSIGLNFICTHNSRRSHLAQIWAAVAAERYGVQDATFHSGGTESTACNERIVRSLRTAGFSVVALDPTVDNPHYWVQYDERVSPLSLHSKRYDAEENPSSGFFAMMCCDHADQACPLIHGAIGRVALDYRDPKESDGTPQETETYNQRRDEIGAEMLFLLRTIADRVKSGE